MDVLHQLRILRGEVAAANSRIRDLEAANAALRGQIDAYDRRARLAEASVRTAWRQVATR